MQKIIHRYNAGNSSNENYFADLIDLLNKMNDGELRTAREGLTEEDLEIFDLLKKEKADERRGAKCETCH